MRASAGRPTSHEYARSLHPHERLIALRSFAREAIEEAEATAEMSYIDYYAFDALSFDCYGTLIDWKAGSWPRWSRSSPTAPTRGRCSRLRAS